MKIKLLVLTKIIKKYQSKLFVNRTCFCYNKFKKEGGFLWLEKEK